MAHVMKESRHSQNPTPVRQAVRLAKFPQLVSNMLRYVVAVRHDVEYASCELHDAERVLEPLVCCSRVNETSQGELMDMAQPLEGSRVEGFTLVTVHSDKRVNRVSDFVNVLRHSRPHR